MDLFTVLIDSMKTAVRDRVAAGHMIAVIRELFAGREPRGFPDDLVAFDHELAAIRVRDDPLASEQGHGSIGSVLDGDEINEGVRFVGRERRPAVMIGELVEAGS